MGASRAHVTLALLSVFVLAVVDGVPSISHRSNNVRNAADKLQITPHWLSLRRESPQTSLNRKCCRRSLDWLESVIRVSFLCVTVGNWFLHVFAEQRGDLAKYERNGGQSRNFEEIYSMWTQPKPKPKPEPEPEPEPVELFYFTSQGRTHTENCLTWQLHCFFKLNFTVKFMKPLHSKQLISAVRNLNWRSPFCRQQSRRHRNTGKRHHRQQKYSIPHQYDSEYQGQSRCRKLTILKFLDQVRRGISRGFGSFRNVFSEKKLYAMQKSSMSSHRYPFGQ